MDNTIANQHYCLARIAPASEGFSVDLSRFPNHIRMCALHCFNHVLPSLPCSSSSSEQEISDHPAFQNADSIEKIISNSNQGSSMTQQMFPASYQSQTDNTTCSWKRSDGYKSHYFHADSNACVTPFHAVKYKPADRLENENFKEQKD